MYGIVLEGGGARGAYQVGVWKALNDLGVEYAGVAGASVGAINGAMMIQGDLERAIDIWSNLTPSQVVRLDEEVKKGDAVSLLHAVKTLFREGGMDVTPLRLLLEGAIEEERIRETGKVFGLITISLPEFQPLRLYLEDIPRGKLVDYLLASANLPLFKRQKVDGRTFMDGGVYDNLPISLLTDRGFR
ncbi:MAG: patatin-like phospholipase family protein, partial [Thermacetogeniaceae bacterium]